MFQEGGISVRQFNLLENGGLHTQSISSVNQNSYSMAREHATKNTDQPGRFKIEKYNSPLLQPHGTNSFQNVEHASTGPKNYEYMKSNQQVINRQNLKPLPATTSNKVGDRNIPSARLLNALDQPSQ